MEKPAGTPVNCRLTEWIRSVIVGLEKSIHDIEGWSGLLSVTQQTIGRWLDGRSFPTPRELDALLFILERRYSAVATGHLTAFSAFAADPIREVAPHLRTRSRTLEDYLLIGSLNRLKDAIAPLPPSRRSVLLEEMIAKCNEEVLASHGHPT